MTEIEAETVKEILPYNAKEFPEALNRLLQSPIISTLAQIYFSHLAYDNFLKMAKTITDVDTFQAKIISTTINSALKQSSAGFSMSGLEKCDPKKRYLYISNHRDIVCDPALFTNGLFLAGHKTPKICLGDNLLTSQLIVDLVKMNKGITVKRNLSTRELFKWSVLLSKLIRDQIENQIESIWIAQREGRAKDGNDFTHPGILKMLNISGNGTFVENIKSLNVIPVSVSYEYDPCDIVKAVELYTVSIQGTYQKAPNEDTISIITGIRDYKGRIHITVGSEISEAYEQAHQKTSKHDQIQILVDAIDHQIQAQYRLWPSNYIAYDLLENSNKMNDHYSNSEKEEFITRMDEKIGKVSGDGSKKDGIRKIFLDAYANPVKNSLHKRSTP